MNWNDALIVVAVVGFLALPILAWCVVAAVIVARRRARFFAEYQRHKEGRKKGSIPW